MHFFTKTALASILASTSLFAAPGLTVSGSDLLYNGKKIFFSGANLAWTNYNSDVGDAPLDENAWRKAVESIRKSGGNAIRWWLFNNMSQSPAIDTTTNLVSGLKENTIANMKKALDIAEEYGVMVSMCLFSHNLMEPDQWGLYNEKLNITANKKLFEDAGTEAFINNALLPVVKAIGNHNALMTWEIFNEPEGMTSVGWTQEKLSKETLQKFTNKVAAAIHSENPELLVSTGSVNIQYQEWWNDSNLVAAGGKENGTLDFFQTHYYPYYQANEVSPFINSRAAFATKYKFDNKPMIIGEFPASGWAGDTYVSTMAAKTEITPETCYRFPFENGYAGSLAWQFIGDDTESQFGGYTYTIDPALDGMKKLWATDSASIKIKDVVIEETSGNGLMAVTYGGDGNQHIEYQKTWDLSAANTFSFVVKNNGTTEADLYLRFKLTDAWTWTDVEGNCLIPAGEKKTCSFDISSYADRNKTLSTIIGNYTSGGFVGTLLFDDFIAGTETLWNFDADKYDVFSRESQMTEELIPEIKVVYDEDYVFGSSTPIIKNNSRKISGFALQNKTLQISFANTLKTEIRIFDMQGNCVKTLHKGILNAGTHAFEISNINTGAYILSVRAKGLNQTQTFTVK